MPFAQLWQISEIDVNDSNLSHPIQIMQIWIRCEKKPIPPTHPIQIMQIWIRCEKNLVSLPAT